MKTATERDNNRTARYRDLLENSEAWEPRTAVKEMLEDIDALFDIGEKIGASHVVYVNAYLQPVYEELSKSLHGLGYFIAEYDRESITVCY
jgi:hypothetical protein